MSQPLQKFAVYGAITKATEADDGTLTVEGVASTGTRDSAGEIILPSAMKAALPDYTGAVREMHQSIAAGRAVSIFVDDDGITRITALVVDPGTVLKVKHLVLKGFSVAGKVLERDKIDPRTITKLRLTEVSLVDVPCNAQCVVELVKLDAAEFAPRRSPEVEDPVAALANALDRAEQQVAALDPLAAMHAIVDKALSAQPGARPAPPTNVVDIQAAMAKRERVRTRLAGDESPEVARLLKMLHDGSQVGALAKYVAVLEDRVSVLEAMPMPPKAAASYHAVNKGEDANPGEVLPPTATADQVMKAMEAMPEAERANLAMKFALSRPMRVLGPGE